MAYVTRPAAIETVPRLPLLVLTAVTVSGSPSGSLSFHSSLATGKTAGVLLGVVKVSGLAIGARLSATTALELRMAEAEDWKR